MAFLSNIVSKLISKVEEYVKIAPWFQYVTLQVGMIPTSHTWISVSAAAASLGVFLLRAGTLGPNDPGRREGLSIVGYPTMMVGALTHHPGYQFVGFALAMTSFVYELIYP